MFHLFSLLLPAPGKRIFPVIFSHLRNISHNFQQMERCLDSTSTAKEKTTMTITFFNERGLVCCQGSPFGDLTIRMPHLPGTRKICQGEAPWETGCSTQRQGLSMTRTGVHSEPPPFPNMENTTDIASTIRIGSVHFAAITASLVAYNASGIARSSAPCTRPEPGTPA